MGKSYFWSSDGERERVKNRLFTSYCSNLFLCSLWANYRKSSMSHFIVSYNNDFRISRGRHRVLGTEDEPFLAIQLAMSI